MSVNIKYAVALFSALDVSVRKKNHATCTIFSAFCTKPNNPLCCKRPRQSLYINLLAHLSRRLMGELIVYQSLRRPSVVCRPSSVLRPSVRPQFQTSYSLNHWANLIQISYGDSLGRGNESLFKWSWSHDQDGRHAHIW